jgi:hypothetical protein
MVKNGLQDKSNTNKLVVRVTGAPIFARYVQYYTHGVGISPRTTLARVSCHCWLRHFNGFGNTFVGYELSLLPAHRCHYFFHAPSPLSTRDCSILKDCETGDRHGNTFPYRHVSCSLHSSEKYFTQKAAYVSK